MKCFRFPLLLLGLLPSLGCVQVVDVRSHLEAQANPGSELQQTQFAYIGIVDTPDGPVYVATQRLVIPGMLAPRGQSRILLFDHKYTLIKNYSGLNATPLWCEGSKVYLFGHGYIPGVPFDSRTVSLFSQDEAPRANVLDLSAGVESAVMRRERMYGSSGGIEDDPFESDGV